MKNIEKECNRIFMELKLKNLKFYVTRREGFEPSRPRGPQAG